MRFLVTLRVKVKGWLGSPLGLGYGLGKLSYRTGGLPPGLGFRLGTGGVSIIPRVFRFTDLIARVLGFKDLIGTPFFVRLVNLKTL